MDEKDLNAAIRRARATAKRKAQRIAKRENLTHDQISKFDPTHNSTSQGLSHQEKLQYLDRLKAFNHKDTNLFFGANDQPISGQQWKKFKDAEKAANEFIKADMAPYNKVDHPYSQMTIQEYFRAIRSERRGFIVDDASGSGMMPTNKKPGQIGDIQAATEMLLEKISPGYRLKKYELARYQFREMVNKIGDINLIDQADRLTERQFWGLWNYTEFANDVSFVYESIKIGMSTTKPALTQSMGKAHDYVQWASQKL
jgi:hypothetical protein